MGPADHERADVDRVHQGYLGRTRSEDDTGSRSGFAGASRFLMKLGPIDGEPFPDFGETTRSWSTLGLASGREEIVSETQESGARIGG